MRRRRHLAYFGSEEWKIVSARHRVIHERGGDELPGTGIVEALLKQRLPYALSNSPMCLPMNNKRVYSSADVINRRVADDFDEA